MDFGFWICDRDEITSREQLMESIEDPGYFSPKRAYHGIFGPKRAEIDERLLKLRWRLGGVKNTNFKNSMGVLSNPISFAIRISKQILFLF